MGFVGDTLGGIDGIQWYYIVGIVIFVGLFIGVAIYTYNIPKKDLNKFKSSIFEKEEVNKKKGHNYETYLLKYHDETVAIKKLEDYFSNTPSKYSKKSQELFFLLIECEQFKDKCVYFGAHNKEYGILDRELKRYYYYDFVCIDLKLSIEFHGDHYHGNPKYYMPNDMLKGRGMTKTLAKDKWEYDDRKVKLMYNDRGFDTIIIWESDYDYNKCETVDRILSYVDGRI